MSYLILSLSALHIHINAIVLFLTLYINIHMYRYLWWALNNCCVDQEGNQVCILMYICIIWFKICTHVVYILHRCIQHILSAYMYTLYMYSYTMSDLISYSSYITRVYIPIYIQQPCSTVERQNILIEARDGRHHVSL